MKRNFFLLAALLSCAASFAQTTWKADANHSKITFTITHLAISDVAGLFKTFDATITSAKPDFSDAVVDVTIQTASVNTEIEKRDNDLRSPNFFESDKYPTMTFKSTGISKVSEGKYKLDGVLTLHGTAKPVSLNMWYRGTIIHPMSKAPTAGFEITGVIKRSDFAFAPKYSMILSDEVNIKADGEFSQPK